MIRTSHLFFIFFLFSSNAISQNYWQQSVDYTMNVNIDVKTFQYNGKQKLIYSNNSPDTIHKV